MNCPHSQAAGSSSQRQGTQVIHAVRSSQGVHGRPTHQEEADVHGELPHGEDDHYTLEVDHGARIHKLYEDNTLEDVRSLDATQLATRRSGASSLNSSHSCRPLAMDRRCPSRGVRRDLDLETNEIAKGQAIDRNPNSRILWSDVSDDEAYVDCSCDDALGVSCVDSLAMDSLGADGPAGSSTMGCAHERTGIYASNHVYYIYSEDTPITRSMDFDFLRPFSFELYGSDPLCTQVVDAYLYAVRTPPSNGNKWKKRQGAKATKKLERLESVGHELNSHEATLFRALAARCNYLAQDRADIAYSAKELCREFAVPNKKSYQKLKRLARYLAGTPRLIYNYPWQNEPAGIRVFVDTDFAGCKATRRSTSGGVAMFGGHCIKHWSKTQSTVCLSSGEAELRGIADGLAQALGLQSIARDLGFTWSIDMFSDATAAIGIARRRGMGRIRHLDVTDLWIQEQFNNKKATLNKVLGADNPADLLTKYTDKAVLVKALAAMGFIAMTGRSPVAPAAMGTTTNQNSTSQKRK